MMTKNTGGISVDVLAALLLLILSGETLGAIAETNADGSYFAVPWLEHTLSLLTESNEFIGYPEKLKHILSLSRCENSPHYHPQIFCLNRQLNKIQSSPPLYMNLYLFLYLNGIYLIIGMAIILLDYIDFAVAREYQDSAILYNMIAFSYLVIFRFWALHQYELYCNPEKQRKAMEEIYLQWFIFGRLLFD